MNAITAESVPQGDPARKLLDVRTYQTDRSAQLHEKIRHELAMMPYISEFDFISFTQSGADVILTGWTIRTTNRSTAYNVVKDIPGVETVINNIELLPLGSFDMQIRAAATSGPPAAVVEDTSGVMAPTSRSSSRTGRSSCWAR